MRLKDIFKDIYKGVRIETDNSQEPLDAYVIETKDVEACGINYTKPEEPIKMKIKDKYFLRKDDIIIASIPSQATNHVGYCSEIENEKVIIKKNFFILRNLYKDNYNPEFIAEYLEYFGIEEAKKNKSNNSFATIEIEEIEIPEIPIEKQNELVSIFKPINSRNNLYRKIINNCNAIKKIMILEVIKDEK